MLCKLALGEEESILTGASVIDHGKFHSTTPATSEFIGEGFKSLIESTNCCPMVDFTVDLGKSLPVLSVFLVNSAHSISHQYRIGVSHIRIGEDQTEYSTSNSVIVDNITDGGFFEAPLILTGRYLTIRRDLVSPAQNDNWYNLLKLKAYQTPNLIKVYEASI